VLAGPWKQGVPVSPPVLPLPTPAPWELPLRSDTCPALPRLAAGSNTAPPQHPPSSALTLQRLQALARLDVPDLDCGVGVARYEDVVTQLHATGERLVPHQSVQAVPALYVPHSNRRVQRAADDVRPIELPRMTPVSTARAEGGGVLFAAAVGGLGHGRSTDGSLADRGARACGSVFPPTNRPGVPVPAARACVGRRGRASLPGPDMGCVSLQHVRRVGKSYWRESSGGLRG